MKDEVDIRISVFFDGTNNNRYNTEARLEYDKSLRGKSDNPQSSAIYEQRKNDGKSGYNVDDSYSNDYSNVARLFKNYLEEPTNSDTRTGRIYIEGIGTATTEEDFANGIGRDDNKLGGGLGAGDTGIPVKVEKGCKMLAKKIDKIAARKKIKSLTVDVFGFSRGAAAARQFIYEITKKEIPAHSETYVTPTGMPSTRQIAAVPARGALGVALNEMSLKIEGEFKIAFAGLFDTVSSYKGTVKLHMDAVMLAKNVLHLTAMDERRAQFALTDIVTSKGASHEKALPGVHSDIGGGYNPVVYDESRIIFAGNYSDMDKEIEYYLEEGWYWNEKQLKKNWGFWGTASGNLPNNWGKNAIQGYISTVGKKEVHNQYSFIPLLIMKDMAVQYPNYIKFNKIIDKTFIIPEKLNYTNWRLREYVFNNGTPMLFYTRKQIDKEIDLLKLLNNPSRIEKPYIAEASTTRVEKTIYEPLKKQQPMQKPQSMQEYITRQVNEAEKERQANALNPDDFPDHPALQEKIRDHITLMYLRANYFHVSHKCSALKAITGISYFDPYKASIRAKPSREIIHS